MEDNKVNTPVNCQNQGGPTVTAEELRLWLDIGAKAVFKILTHNGHQWMQGTGGFYEHEINGQKRVFFITCNHVILLMNFVARKYIFLILKSSRILASL
jgi:hypothetical protein